MNEEILLQDLPAAVQKSVEVRPTTTRYTFQAGYPMPRCDSHVACLWKLLKMGRELGTSRIQTECSISLRYCTFSSNRLALQVSNVRGEMDKASSLQVTSKLVPKVCLQDKHFESPQFGRGIHSMP